MSNTLKDKIRGKLRKNKNLNDYLRHFDALSSNDQKKIINYNKNPSWWNNERNNRPKRRQDKLLCHRIKGERNLRCDEYFIGDDLLFSDDRKPALWYW